MPQPLTKIIHTAERVKLFRISFDPDRPVETFAIPTRGLQTQGEPSVNDLSEADLILAIDDDGPYAE